MQNSLNSLLQHLQLPRQFLLALSHGLSQCLWHPHQCLWHPQEQQLDGAGYQMQGHKRGLVRGLWASKAAAGWPGRPTAGQRVGMTGYVRACEQMGMFVCACVCVRVGICGCTSTCERGNVYVCVFVCGYVWVHERTRAWECVCVCMRVGMCGYVSECEHGNVYVLVCVWVCVGACGYVWKGGREGWRWHVGWPVNIAAG